MSFVKGTLEEIEETLNLFRKLSIRDTYSERKIMDETTLQTFFNAAVKQATEQTRKEFQGIIDGLNDKITALQPIATVEEYKSIEIVDGVSCDESLDIVKSIPEFAGDPSRYVSWRQAAITAHKLYVKYVGSSKYYQAVAIIRNKIVGNADSVLSAYNTVLNFNAILSRLDFAYSDKKSIFALEQELSTLRQGNKSITHFYSDVEKKLISIINKVIMSNDGNIPLIQSLNRKYRMDALRVFVSGLRKPLCDTLFSCQPNDLPTALALAQELEANQSRCQFATIYNNGLNRAQHNHLEQPYQRFTPLNTSPPVNQPSEHYFKKFTDNSSFNKMQQPINPRQQFFSQSRPHSSINIQPPNTQNYGFQPRSLALDTDVSMRTVKSNNTRRGNFNSGRHNFQKMQPINNMSHEVQQPLEWEEDPSANIKYVPKDDQTYQCTPFEDEINFLGEPQFFPTSSDQ